MILNINKPAGMTSRAVVDSVQHLMWPLKCGHTGTLDPLATGVLVICIDKATRLVPYVHELSKSYIGTFQTGVVSDSDDVEGAVVRLSNPPLITAEVLNRLLPDYLGLIQQVPPVYSAVLVAGKRAYNLARRGAEVELAPRPVHVYELQVMHCESQEFTLRVDCGTGTYIRSIGRDLARQAGSGAVMSQLVRTAIGPFRLEDAVELEGLTKERILQHATPSLSVLPHFPTLSLDGEALERVHRGQPLTIDPENFPLPEICPAQLSSERTILGQRNPDLIAALNPGGELVALLEEKTGRFWPRQVFIHKR